MIISRTQLIIQPCIRINVSIPRTSHGDIRGPRNAGKLRACANSGYQAQFPHDNAPGYEASLLSSKLYHHF